MSSASPWSAAVTSASFWYGPAARTVAVMSIVAVEPAATTATSHTPVPALKTPSPEALTKA